MTIFELKNSVYIKLKKYPVIADFKENNQVMKQKKHLISFIHLPGRIIKNPLKNSRLVILTSYILNYAWIFTNKYRVSQYCIGVCFPSVTLMWHLTYFHSLSRDILLMKQFLNKPATA